MKKILMILIASLLFAPAFAQRGKKDIVYLKSGAIIRGQLITNDAEDVKIFSAGNYLVFKKTEVDSLVKFSNKIRIDKGMDYFFDTSAGVLVGNSGNNQSAPFSFMSSVNFNVDGKWYAGFGLGTEFLEESYMPAFAQFQYKFRDSNITPFINLQAGYLVALEDGNRSQLINYYDYSSAWPRSQNSKLNAEGGFMINPSIGFQRYTSDNFGWFFSFGYRLHNLNYSGENDYKLETRFSRLSLRIGFIFN
ncbi:MAG: hypothetical protein WAO52_04890 [Prolixibacteraceae bacterium]